MTRDEAIEIYAKSHRDGDNCPMERWQAENEVNCLVALGILKLDEPKSAAQEFDDLVDRCFASPTAYLIKSFMESYGFKVVRK